jgi:hypothetical protein
MNDVPKSLGALLFELPAVKRAKMHRWQSASCCPLAALARSYDVSKNTISRLTTQ